MSGPGYKIHEIEQAICRRFDVGPAWLRSPARSQEIAGPRQLAMYLCRELTGASLPKIGQHFGGRDHTTVLHAQRKIHRLMMESQTIPRYASEIMGLMESDRPPRKPPAIAGLIEHKGAAS